MATLSEMFISDIQKQNSEPLSKSDAGWQTGAQLAQLQQQKQKQAQDIQAKLQELQQAKLEKMYGFVADSKNYKNPSDRKNYLKAAIGYRNAMGINSDLIPDEAILSLGSDENQGRLATLDVMLKNGEMSPEQYLTTVKDPQLFGKVQPTVEAATYDADPDKTIEAILNRKSAEAAAAKKVDGTQGRFDENFEFKIADKLNTLGVPTLKGSLSRLDSLVPGGLDGWKPGKAIPGVSGAEGALPGNRLKGAANKMRGEALSVGNQIIKMRTGAAMSDSEAGRILGEIGFVPTVGENGTWTGLAFKGIQSEENFVNGMKRARSHLEATEDTYRRVNPEMYDKISPPIRRTKVSGTMGGDPKAKAAAYLKLYPPEKYPNDPNVKKAQAVLKGG